MEEDHPLRETLEKAASGRFPPADGAVRVVPSPPGRSDAVVAFTAHHIVAADVESDEVLRRLPPGDLVAPMGPRFLAWMGERLGTTPGSLDVVLCARGSAIGDGKLLLPATDLDHDRVARAQRYRESVSIYGDVDGLAVVILGRGLALRREISLEINEKARGRGLGRRLLLAARSVTPEDEFLFAQVAPGNAASLRAFLAAGFTPIGAEVLFLRTSPI